MVSHGLPSFNSLARISTELQVTSRYVVGQNRQWAVFAVLPGGGECYIVEFSVKMMKGSSNHVMQVEWARRQYYGVLRVLRPDAVGLADAFGLSDYLLNSALGRADGDVYRALLAAAQASPLNETEEGPAWHSILKPRLTPRARL